MGLAKGQYWFLGVSFWDGLGDCVNSTYRQTQPTEAGVLGG